MLSLGALLNFQGCTDYLLCLHGVVQQPLHDGVKGIECNAMTKMAVKRTGVVEKH